MTGLLILVSVFVALAFLIWFFVVRDKDLAAVNKFSKKYRDRHGFKPEFDEVKSFFPQITLMPQESDAAEKLAQQDPYSKLIFFDPRTARATRRPASRAEQEILANACAGRLINID